MLVASCSGCKNNDNNNVHKSEKIEIYDFILNIHKLKYVTGRS